MKKLLSFGLMALCAGATLGCSSAPKASASAPSSAKPAQGLPALYRDISYPAFHYSPPKPDDYRVQLSDSVSAYMVSDTSLPLVQLTLYFRESALPKTPAQSAALQLLSSLYRRGGSAHLSPAALDDSLEFLSASLNGGLGDRFSTISIDCLSRDLPAVMGLLRTVFLEPGLDSLRLELAKAAALQNLAHRFDQPAAQLSALSAHSLYKTHPLLWDPDSAEIAAVGRAELLSLSQGYFIPRRVYIAASGDFQRDSLSAQLRSLFASWKPVPAGSPVSVPPLQFRQAPGVYLSDKDISQANITMAQPFVKRPHPDYYPAMVASYILGGSGFTSRLTERVRSDEGLAYSIYSFAESDYFDVGTAGVALQTKATSVPFALSIIQEEIAKLAAHGPTPEELAGAKLALVQSLPGMFDTPEATAEAFALSELWGRSRTHYADYAAKVEAVTADQVRAMIGKYFDFSRMHIAIVGPASVIQKPDSVHGHSLADFGPLTPVPADSLRFR